MTSKTNSIQYQNDKNRNLKMEVRYNVPMGFFGELRSLRFEREIVTKAMFLNCQKQGQPAKINSAGRESKVRILL